MANIHNLTNNEIELKIMKILYANIDINLTKYYIYEKLLEDLEIDINIDSTSTIAMDKVKAVITEVRRFRSDQGLKPTQFIPGSFANLANDGIDKFEPALRSVLKVSTPESSFAPSASLAIGAVTIDLDLSGTVDVDAERARLSKDLATASKDRETAISKLENADFMTKAPEKVVATIKERLETCDAEILRINERLSALAGS